MTTHERITTKKLNERSRAEDKANEQIDDIRRIRAAGDIHDRPRVPLSTADQKFLETFLQMVASYAVHDRSWIKLTTEQRVTIDSMRGQHGL
jgi:MoxR-like ATPase